jgi:hypothetical protein
LSLVEGFKQPTKNKGRLFWIYMFFEKKEKVEKDKISIVLGIKAFYKLLRCHKVVKLVLFDSVGSLVGSTECLLIWIVLDLKTHKLGLLFIVSEFTSFWSRLRTTRQSSLVGVGGYLARPVKYSWRL